MIIEAFKNHKMDWNIWFIIYSSQPNFANLRAVFENQVASILYIDSADGTPFQNMAKGLKLSF